MTGHQWGEIAARFDLARASRFREVIRRRARIAALPPAIIAAIGSREMRWSETALGCGPGRWLGDPYPRDATTGKVPDWHGCGPMQIDDRSEPAWCHDWKAGRLTEEDGIEMGIHVFVAKMQVLTVAIRDLSFRDLLFACLAAYNCGEHNVLKARAEKHALDFYTTPIDGRVHGQPFKPGDYASDVIARADFFVANGFPDNIGAAPWDRAHGG